MRSKKEDAYEPEMKKKSKKKKSKKNPFGKY